MAPTVCLAEFPMAGSTVSAYVCRRRRTRNVSNIKRQTSAPEQILRSGTVNEPISKTSSHDDCSRELDYADAMPDCFVFDKRLPTNVDENEREKLVSRKKDLLNIVIRTIILVRRNHILQRRVNALRAETRRYLCYSSSDPKNQHRRRRLLRAERPRAEDEIVVSSSTDRVVSTSLPFGSPRPIENSSHGVTVPSDSRDRDANDGRLSDKFDGSTRSGC